MKARVHGTLPLLVATALFTQVTRAPAILAVLVAGSAIALWIAPRLEVSRFIQRVTLLVVAIVGALIGGALLQNAPGIGPAGLASFWGTLAMTSLFLALARRFFQTAEGGFKADFALSAMAFVACGEKRTGVAYTVLAVLFVATVIAALRAQGPRGTGWLVERKARGALGTILAVSALLTATSMVALPWLEDLTQHALQRVIFAGTESKTGFTDRVRLGAADRILASDEMVMRVYGPHTDYLRGQVYDRYEQGGWEASDRTSREVVTVLGRPSGPGVIEIRAVGDSFGRERRPRYFLPLGARRIGTAHGRAMADALGTLRPFQGDAPTPIYFEAGGPGDLPVLTPTDEDLRVPENLRAPLLAIVDEWTRDMDTPRQKLSAIEHHLTHGFAYSLEPAHPERRDEAFILHFLSHSRRGHCEYFATAMALLGRTAGVPVRIVGGYRVSEHNAIGGYDVVRENNAHAWVEGWLEGEGWRTFEPTPATEANLSRDSRVLGALADLAASTWDRTLDAIAQASLWQILALLALAVGLLAVVRTLRARREQALLGTDGMRVPPLPCFARLEVAMELRGHARGASETLEQYAARLREADLEDAADLVLTYGALRYGGVGEPSTVIAALERYVGGLALPAAK